MATVSVELLLKDIEQLSVDEQFELVTSILTNLRESKRSRPKRSLYGLVADTGNAPSSEDIDSVRKEMWSDFPREDI